MKKLLFIVIILLTLIFLYGKYIEPNTLLTKEYTIVSDKIPESFKELKIVQFSDILYDKNISNLNKLVKIINNENPDIIVFSGDLFNNENDYNDEDYTNLENFLKELNANFYKYAISGENDQKYIDKYKNILNNSNFKYLDNDSELFFYKDVTPIKIIGYTNETDLSKLLESEIEYNYSLVLTHKPDNILEIKKYNIDTVLSGHSLGGVINIPYYGGLIKFDGSNTYISNYYKVDNTELFVNNGIGYKMFEFRLFNPPTINIYRFDNN